MFIYELEKEELVTLTVKMKERDKMEWKCPVLDVSAKGKCILVPPLKYEDKVLAFDKEGVIAEVVAIRDGKPVIFRGCYVQYIKFRDQKYHAIITRENGVNLNRRSHFRVPIDEYCYVNHGKATVDAYIVDMSSSGFSFIVGHYDNQNMEYVQVLYKDTLMDMEISVMGRVVRREDREDGKTLFGCYMIPRPEIDRYITTRQRKIMKPKDREDGSSGISV